MASVRQKLGAVLVGLVMATLVMELGLRVLGLGFGSSPMEPDPFLHHVHPRNYTFRQQHPSGELGGFDLHYNDERRVFAGPGAPAPPASPTGCRVAIMGDSFTEGGQVPYEASFAGLLDRAARGACEVRNYGVRSYSPAIYLVQWTREVQPWQPTHVFLLLFGNDVREDVNYMATSIRDRDGWPTAIQGPDDGWLFSQLRKSYVARFARLIYMQVTWAWSHYGQEQWTIGGVVEEDPEWGGPTPGLIQELARRVKADGAELMVMAVPSRYRLMGDGRIKPAGDFHQTIKGWTQAQGIPFLDLYSPFERASKAGVPLFYLQDIHFNGEGHTLTAAAIARSAPQVFPQWQSISSRAVQAAFP
jgi:lysophospholipase L1-like esterase